MTGLRNICRRAAAIAVTALVLISTAITLSACNTMAGAGKDISATGHAITGGADKTKQALPPNP